MKLRKSTWVLGLGLTGLLLLQPVLSDGRSSDQVVPATHSTQEEGGSLKTHAVRDGECLSVIAERYSVSIQNLKAANRLIGDTIFPGQILTIGSSREKEWKEAWNWPVEGEISSPFGMREGKMHEGLDIANDEGTLVYAAKSGRVYYAEWCTGYGLTVMIDHGDGTESIYGHLSKLDVQEGQKVNRGQQIAWMGSTGRSTGPHLHFEIRDKGEPINPINVLPQESAAVVKMK